MPLKDLDKLTVVKLRAELIARGLESKGNKPFLIGDNFKWHDIGIGPYNSNGILLERLRIALEQEQQHGGVGPEIKMFSSTDTHSASGASDHDTSMEGEPTEAELSGSSNPGEMTGTSPVKGSNGTSEGKLSSHPLKPVSFTVFVYICLFFLAAGVLNNGSHPLPHVPIVEAVPEPHQEEKLQPAPVEKAVDLPQSALEMTSIPPLVDVEDSKADELDASSTAPNDSIMAVYGGKDETFAAMDDSVLERAEEAPAANDIQVATKAEPPVLENGEEPKEEQAEAVPEQETATSSTEQVKMEVSATEDAVPAIAADGIPKEEKTDDKSDRGSKRQRDRQVINYYLLMVFFFLAFLTKLVMHFFDIGLRVQPAAV